MINIFEELEKKLKEKIYNPPHPHTLREWEGKMLYEMGFDDGLLGQLCVARSIVSVVQIAEEGRRIGIKEGKALAKKEVRQLLGLT